MREAGRARVARVALALLLTAAQLRAARAVQLPAPGAHPIDHQAHARPGGPYFAVDWDNDGAELVTVDAAQSHTHYFDHGPPPASGTIVRYEWFSLHTGAALLRSKSPYLTAYFYVGVTILKLVVTDSTGDAAHAYTFVSVRRPLLTENGQPAVHRIHPAAGTTAGGTLVTVYGAAFYNHPRVYFADTFITPELVSDTQLKFRVPPVDRPQRVRVHVTTGFGTSAQPVFFTYDKSGGNPVKFRATYVTTPSGHHFSIPEVTALKLGPDGKYYAGTLDGYVRVLAIDRRLVVRSSCTSHNVGPSRSVLGLAFHPNEHRPPAVYLSTSTLAWHNKPTADDWDNGKIEIWSKHHDADCLSYARTLVSGLPVSKGDHGVNGMVFLSDGSLLVAVGGSTNAGVHTHNDNLGGVPESPLSAAVLVVNTFNHAFDGKIVYSGRHDPGTATVISGSAAVYASGLRNVYGITRHSNGNIYALDNGPNIGKGLGATGCNTAGKQEGFRDKLVHIKEGAYYGHPNWNRGRFDKRQCAFVRGDAAAQPGYTPPMADLGSSTNGIVEYTANTFSSKLRGYLILSKMSWELNGLLKVAKPDASGTALVDEPYEVFNDSGLVVEMGPYGELLMPKIKQAKILGLIPDEPMSNSLHVIAVTPRRGPVLGGNNVLVTGSGFARGVRILFGKQECTEYGDIAEDGSSIMCLVPPHISGPHNVPVIAKTEGFRSRPSGDGEYEYMDL